MNKASIPNFLYMKLTDCPNTTNEAANIHRKWSMHVWSEPIKDGGSFLHIIEKATEEDYVQSSFCRYHWTSEFSETGL